MNKIAGPQRSTRRSRAPQPKTSEMSDALISFRDTDGDPSDRRTTMKPVDDDPSHHHDVCRDETGEEPLYYCSICSRVYEDTAS